jgi:thiamine biosynthesis protein ThiS
MKLKVNGTYRDIDVDSITIAELLVKLSYSSPCIVVRYRDKIVLNEDYNNITLCDGDDIFLIHTFAGG